MSKKLTNIYAIMLFLFQVVWMPVHAETKYVTPTDFSTVYAGVLDGDVIVMSAGTYSSNIAFPAGIAVTLRNADPANTTVEFTGTVLVPTVADGSLVFDGISISSSQSYWMGGDVPNIKLISFQNCVIKNLPRCLLKFNESASVVSKIEFYNTIIQDCGTGGYNFMWIKCNVSDVSVKNCTLYNYLSGENFFSTHAIAPTHTNNVLNFDFQNNTVYKWSKASTFALCKTEGKYSTSSIFTFKNNIISVPGVAGQVPYLLYVTGGTLVAEKNLIVEYGAYNQISAVSSAISDLTLAGLGMSSLTFPNPTAGDFTIYSNSPLATASSTGGVVGDPRWLKEATTLYTLTTGLASGVDANAGSITGPSGDVAINTVVSLTANKNFGFAFEKWVDAEGNTLSTESTYQFTMTANASVFAVFKAVNVYKLSLSIAGARGYGKVSVSTKGRDGGYEYYEAGTSLELTAASNEVIIFSNWDGTDTNKSKTITMNGDVSVVVNFYENDYIGGWDFVSGASQSRPADYFTNEENVPELGMYTSTDNTLYSGWWLRQQGSRYAGTIWKARSSADQYYYFQTLFSTIGYEDVTVKYSLMGSYYGNDVWKLQYSFNGTDYVDAASVNVSTSAFTDFSTTIAGTGGKASVYLRLIPDVTSAIHGNISDVDGTYIADVYILANKTLTADSEAPLLGSTIPVANAVSVTANGKIILTFDEKIQVGKGDCVLNNGVVLSGVCTSKTASFDYSGLDYNTQYTFTIPDGAITDLSGNSFAGSSIVFTTMARPAVAIKGYDFVVDPTATPVAGKIGNTIASAFAAVPDNNVSRFHILVKNGIYNEIVELASGKNNVSLIGQSVDGVVIAGSRTGITLPVVKIAANNFYCENITFQNTLGLTNGVGVAVNTGGLKNVYKNVRMLGGQDTQVTSGTRHYLESCDIHGTVDFICGDGDVFYQNCRLYLEERGSADVIVAASTSSSQQYGYVFNHCTIDGSATSNDGQFSLGRPWKNSPRAVYLNAKMNILPITQGWTSMGVVPAMYAEYGSVNKNDVAVNLANRTNIFSVSSSPVTGSYNPVLTQAEASAYTIENVLGGEEKWQPTLLTEPVVAPSVSFSDKTISWNAVAYAMCYVVTKDGVILDWTTETSFAVSENGDYHVQAASEYGGLSALSNTIIASVSNSTEVNPLDKAPIVFLSKDGKIGVVGIDQLTQVSIYTLQGYLVKLLDVQSDSWIPSFKGVFVVKAVNSRGLITGKVIVD